MFDFRKSISFFPKFDVESSKFPAKSGSWKNPSRSHMTILSVIICVECVKSDELSVCQALVHFVNLRAKFVHWPKNVGLPIRARYKHFKTICDHIFDSWRQFLLLEMMIIQAKSWNFVQLLSFLCASSQYLPTCFCAWPSVSEDHATVFAWDFPTLETFLSCSSRNTWFEHFSVFIDNMKFHSVCIHVEYIQNIHRKDMMSVISDVPISSISSTHNWGVAFFHAFLSSTYTDKNSPCFRCTK